MMTTTERCQQEERLAELFGRQREANDHKDRQGADALFLERVMDSRRARRLPGEGTDKRTRRSAAPPKWWVASRSL